MCEMKAEEGIVGEQMGPVGEAEMGNQRWQGGFTRDQQEQ